MKANRKRASTQWRRVDALTDVQIRKAIRNDLDAAPILTKEWLRRAKLIVPVSKKSVSIRLDEDILNWFKQQGRGYQTRMNAVLRAFVESQR